MSQEEGLETQAIARLKSHGYAVEADIIARLQAELAAGIYTQGMVEAAGRELAEVRAKLTAAYAFDNNAKVAADAEARAEKAEADVKRIAIESGEWARKAGLAEARCKELEDAWIKNDCPTCKDLKARLALAANALREINLGRHGKLDAVMMAVIAWTALMEIDAAHQGQGDKHMDDCGQDGGCNPECRVLPRRKA